MPSDVVIQAELYVAIAVVVLSIAAIASFIVFRGGLVFYVLAAVAIILGLYMSYFISKQSREEAQPAAKRTRKRSR